MVSFILVCFLAALRTICTEAIDDENRPLHIVNGTDAEEGEFPYIVQVRYNNAQSFMCAGVIIAEKWILTAGHCLSSLKYDVVYGTNLLANKVESIPVISQKKHPKFFYLEGSIPEYDLGILELGVNLNFSRTVQPIKLPEANARAPLHVNGTLAGWGLNTSDTYVLKETLQKINLQLLSDEECVRRMKADADFEGFPAELNYCTDDHFSGQCNGDSGSPFVIDDIVYGIVSWSFKPCGSSPGTYTRLTHPEVRMFIKNITSV